MRMRLCGDYIIRMALLLAFFVFGAGCSDGGGIGNDAETLNRQPNRWEKYEVADVDAVGTSLPYVTAVPGGGENIHIACYNAVSPPGGTAYHQLHHLIWHPRLGLRSRTVVDNSPAPSGAAGFDRCAQFSMAMGEDATPIFVYPVEEVVPEIVQIEADIMVNFGDGSLTEYVAAVGYVARNPVYFDGHATSNMSVQVGAAGDVHIAYQFFTEGMDAANYRYPDLFYVHRTREELAQVLSYPEYGAVEEAVDGNTFSTYGVHNSVGYHCTLALDAEERPVIVYAEHPESYAGSFALKAAFRGEDGTWRREVITRLNDGWKVGGIDATVADDGSLSVVYALRAPAPAPDNAHRLMYATNRETGDWRTEIVDETTWCGAYCSIAIDPEGMPAVAYYDERSHSQRPHLFLKFARRDGLRWVRETVDEYESCGRFNSLWFDASGRAAICTYSDLNHRILVFRQEETF